MSSARGAAYRASRVLARASRAPSVGIVRPCHVWRHRRRATTRLDRRASPVLLPRGRRARPDVRPAPSPTTPTATRPGSFDSASSPPAPRPVRRARPFPRVSREPRGRQHRRGHVPTPTRRLPRRRRPRGGRRGGPRGRERRPRAFRAGPGDPTPALVVPDRPGLGTWREWAVRTARDVRKVAPGVPIETAAQLTVNPPTAYRMLTDYVTLRPRAHTR